MLSLIQASEGDKVGYTTYYFTDSGNNEVITTSFTIAKKILARTAILLDIELDKVTVPPVDGATGATRPSRRSDEAFEKNRGQVIVGFEQGIGGNTAFAVNAYRSQEVDYLSNAAVLTISQDLFQRNTTVTVKGQDNIDQVCEILDNGDVVNRDKDVITGALSISQVLSTTTVLNLSYDYMQQTGFLSDPYRRVQIFDQNNAFELIAEKHPDKRTRQAGTMKLSQLITPVDASIIASYRYYFDDWDVDSHTAEFRFNKYITQSWILGFNYRYYQQSGSDFYQDRYTTNIQTEDLFRTADYKLNPFSSNSFGFNVRLLFKQFSEKPGWEFLEKSSFEIMYFRYVNDLDFSADIFQGSLNFAL